MQVEKVLLPFSWIYFRGSDTWDSSGWKNRLEGKQNMSIRRRTRSIQRRAFELNRLAMSSHLS